MKERLKKERKIIVYKADSTEQEIRFFVNENQFVKATKEGDDIVVTGIEDKTYHPHNGCRPPKRRRQ